MNLLLNKRSNFVYLITFAVVILISYLLNTYSGSSLVRKLSESSFWLCVPIFVFSLMTLFLNNSIFLTLRKFTNYYLIISVFVILITPTSAHGMDFLPIIKETVTITLSILYSLISLILILYRHFKSKKLNA